MNPDILKPHEKVLNTTKKLIEVLDSLGRFATYEEFRLKAKEKYFHDIDQHFSEFVGQTSDSFKVFLERQNYVFNISNHTNETFIHLTRDFNFIYGRMAQGIIKCHIDNYEEYICKSDLTKFPKISVESFSEYEFTKTTLTILDMIRTFSKAFPKGTNVINMKRLQDHCSRNLNNFGKSVLMFCTTANDQTGLPKFLSYYSTVFKIEETSGTITIDRRLYSILETILEMDVVWSYVAVSAINNGPDFLVSQLVAELKSYLKRVKILFSKPVNRETIISLLTCRPSFYMLDNTTVRYSSVLVTNHQGSSIENIQKFFYGYLHSVPRVNINNVHEILLSRDSELLRNMEHLDSLTIAKKVFVRPDLFTLTDRYVMLTPAKMRSHFFWRVGLIPVEVPSNILEQDVIPPERPNYIESIGIVTDLGMRSAIVQAQEIDFVANVFCQHATTTVNKNYVPDFSEVLRVGEYVKFVFSYTDKPEPDRPLSYYAFGIVSQKYFRNENEQRNDSSSSDDYADDAPRVPPIHIPVVELPTPDPLQNVRTRFRGPKRSADKKRLTRLDQAELIKKYNLLATVKKIRAAPRTVPLPSERKDKAPPLELWQKTAPDVFPVPDAAAKCDTKSKDSATHADSENSDHKDEGNQASTETAKSRKKKKKQKKRKSSSAGKVEVPERSKTEPKPRPNPETSKKFVPEHVSDDSDNYKEAMSASDQNLHLLQQLHTQYAQTRFVDRIRHHTDIRVPPVIIAPGVRPASPPVPPVEPVYSVRDPETVLPLLASRLQSQSASKGQTSKEPDKPSQITSKIKSSVTPKQTSKVGMASAGKEPQSQKPSDSSSTTGGVFKKPATPSKTSRSTGTRPKLSRPSSGTKSCATNLQPTNPVMDIIDKQILPLMLSKDFRITEITPPREESDDSSESSDQSPVKDKSKKKKHK